MTKPNAGCPALTNENYEYHLSGDCKPYCTCAITGKPCLGRVISDPDDQSSQFFSRAKCSIDPDKAKTCPVYGCSSETLKAILRERLAMENEDRLNAIKA